MPKPKKAFAIEQHGDLLPAVAEWLRGDHGQRAFALIGAAIAENCLERYMKSVMAGNPEFQERLFDPRTNGLFSAFGAKSKAAYGFGLIGPHSFSDLEIIRNIRNTFAHDVFLYDESGARSRVSFQVSEVSKMCSKLWFPDHLDKIRPGDDPLARYFPSRLLDSPDRRFSRTVSVLAWIPTDPDRPNILEQETPENPGFSNSCC
jgi:hypothetical protein